MRVAMYYNNKDVRLEEMPTPKIGPGELLMRVEASGICGSDLMEWYRIKKTPKVLGHEVAGVITSVGEGMTQYKEGDRVVASHHVPCNTCHYCLSGHYTVCDTLRQTNFDPGGFSEYIRLPAINVDRGVYRMPTDISFEEAALTEPLACVLRGQRQVDIQPGDSVLVIGSGMSGLLHIQAARALGAGRVMATWWRREYRREAALRFGADAVIHAEEDIPTRLRQVNDGRLADRVIVCTGAKSAIASALRSVERGGTILFFALTEPDVTIPISLNNIFFDGITLTTSYAGSPADHVKALELIRSRAVRVRDMITHRLSLAETGLGFQLVGEGQDAIKVIIEPQR
jgi:L-iditol 2-dehydrogenase